MLMIEWSLEKHVTLLNKTIYSLAMITFGVMRWEPTKLHALMLRLMIQ